MMKFLLTILIMCMLVSASAPQILIEEEKVSMDVEHENAREIRIALYRSDVSTNPLTVSCFRYGWKVNGREYVFNITEIGRKEVMGVGKNALTNENFDVFIVGASARSYLVDGFNEKWHKNVLNFVANGGGYIGICGGAILASRGYKMPKSAFQRHVNEGVLGMADVYINDDFDGEWQYLLKVGFLNNSGQICVATKIIGGKKIFGDYKKDMLNISYGGGPSFLPAGDGNKIKPMLIYSEELMETKPIHYWIPTLHGWKIWRNVTTDIKGEWAAIETDYGKGKIFLFGPHPEEPFMENGTIVEFFGKSVWGPWWQYLYAWVGGNYTPISQNWWILRRCAAVAAGVNESDLPPLSKEAAIIIKPLNGKFGGVYVNNDSIYINFLRKISKAIGRAIIIGNLTVLVYTVDGIRAEFYIDGKLKETEDEPKEYEIYGYKFNAFSWQLDCTAGFHTLKVIVYSENGNIAWDERKIAVLQ